MVERKKGQSLNDFISEHTDHHIKDHKMTRSRALKAAYEEARSIGYRVPKAPRKKGRRKR